AAAGRDEMRGDAVEILFDREFGFEQIAGLRHPRRGVFAIAWKRQSQRDVDFVIGGELRAPGGGVVGCRQLLAPGRLQGLDARDLGKNSASKSQKSAEHAGRRGPFTKNHSGSSMSKEIGAEKVIIIEHISIACTGEPKIQHKGSKEQRVRGSLGKNPRPLFESLFL